MNPAHDFGPQLLMETCLSCLTAQSANTVYSYFVDALIDQVQKDLVEKAGYSATQASNALYSSGLKIYSTQKPEIQSALDEEFANGENFPANTKVAIEWAMSVVDKDGNTTITARR